MSVPVELADVHHQVADFGPLAFLITVGDDHTSHVVSALVECREDGLAMGAGRRTRANLAAGSGVTLVWPPKPGGPYSLIVDGAADEPVGEDKIVVRPTSAVLHRVAGASDDLPGCVPLSARE